MLAQSSAPRAATDPFQILIWVGSLMAAVMVLTAVLLLIRRRFLAAQRAATSGAGLLETMRQMKLSGQMSEEEFAAIKANLAAKMRKETLETGPNEQISGAKPGLEPKTGPRTTSGSAAPKQREPGANTRTAAAREQRPKSS